MSIFFVETYVVKAEKLAEFLPALHKFLKFKESHLQLFSGLKSWKLFKQDIGQPAGMYVEMWEYENLAQFENVNETIFSNEEMKRISSGFHQLVEPATFSTGVWIQEA